jgi:formate transporter
MQKRFDSRLTTQQEPATTKTELDFLEEKMQKNVSNQCLAPAEIAERVEVAGVTKSKLNTLSTAVLGAMAGAFIGLGAVFMTLVTTSTGLGFGITKLIGGLAFCLGLILVVLAGAELFTGNSLLTVSCMSGRTNLARLTRNWGLVYVANLAGALALVGFMFYTNQWTFLGNQVGANALVIANAKVSLGFSEALVRGILCNFLVCLAVWMAFGARTLAGKIMAILFPITAFVAAGFEHSIANMYFIPMGILMAKQPAVLEAAGVTAASVANLNWTGFVGNLVPVTIGNIVGGGIFVGAMYWLAYLRKARLGEAIKARPWLANLVPVFRPTKPKEPPPLSEIVGAQIEELLRSKLEEPLALDKSCRVILEVLEKAKDDDGFLAKLAENPAKALEDFDMTSEAKAALASGDIRWIESKLGRLKEPLKTWLYARLTQEKW